MKVIERGFVLQRTSYSETSIVLKCFTENFGLKSFLLQGAKKKYAHLIQSMSPIEFTFTKLGDDRLEKMYNVDFFLATSNIQSDPIKVSILFFQNELLKNVFVEGQIEKKIFQFLQEEYYWLNEHSIVNGYLIHWMLELISLLGFDPVEIDEKYTTNDSFLASLKNYDRNDWQKMNLQKVERNTILESLLLYYKDKIPNFKAMKTIDVYHTIWE